MHDMERVRVGLTGLAAVFLITMGAALAFRPPEGKPAISETKSGEPLAQLGVAPGADKEPAATVATADPSTTDSPEQMDSSGAVIVPAPFNAPAATSPAFGSASTAAHGASRI